MARGLLESGGVSAADQAALEAAIRRLVDAAPTALQGPVASTLAPHGKRFRPAVTLCMFDACGGGHGRRARAITAAAVVEAVHAASLVVDDMVDQSPLRRGRASVHAAHGPRVAMLVAAHLVTESFGTMRAQIDLDDGMRSIEEALRALVRAEARPGPATSVADWEAVARGKTSALFEAACRLGAMVADQPVLVPVAGRYGAWLGLAFQAADDLLDTIGSPAKTGKPAGNDSRNGAVNLVHVVGARAAQEQAIEYGLRAVRELRDLPPGPATERLAGLAHQAAHREA